MDSLSLVEGVAGRVMSRMAPDVMGKVKEHLIGGVSASSSDSLPSHKPRRDFLVWSNGLVPVAIWTDALQTADSETVNELFQAEFSSIHHYGPSTDTNQLHRTLRGELLKAEDNAKILIAVSISDSAASADESLSGLVATAAETLSHSMKVHASADDRMKRPLLSILVIVHSSWSAVRCADILHERFPTRILLRRFDTIADPETVLPMFLYEALPLFPVMLPRAALKALRAAWHAAHRLSDVAVMFHSIVSNYEYLARWRGIEDAAAREGDRSAAVGNEVGLLTSVTDGPSPAPRRAVGQKRQRSPAQGDDGTNRIADEATGVPISPSRRGPPAEQRLSGFDAFAQNGVGLSANPLANWPATTHGRPLYSDANTAFINAFLDHARIVGNDDIAREARAFFALYETACNEDWERLRKVTLAIDDEDLDDDGDGVLRKNRAIDELIDQHQGGVVMCPLDHIRLVRDVDSTHAKESGDGNSAGAEGEVEGDSLGEMAAYADLQPMLNPNDDEVVINDPCFPPIAGARVSHLRGVLDELHRAVADPEESLLDIPEPSGGESGDPSFSVAEGSSNAIAPPQESSDELLRRMVAEKKFNFFASEVSDAARVLYVLVEQSSGGASTTASWLAFDALTELCCFASPPRFAAALRELKQAGLVHVNMAKRVLRAAKAA